VARPVPALIAACAVLLAAAPSAGAHAYIREINGELIYVSPDAPSISTLTVRAAGSEIEFRDPSVDQGMEIGPCRPGEIGSHGQPTQAFCSAGSVSRLLIDVTEREDSVTVAVGLPATIFGGPGADQLSGGDAADTVDGGDGNDRVAGGGGNDQLIAGEGVDDVDAGAGDDRIMTRDGLRDVVRCGAGTDAVDADTFDELAADCEGVARAETTPPPESAATAIDRTPPVVDAGAPTLQRLGRRGVVRIAVTSSERGTVGASGFIDIAGLSRPLAFAGARITVAGSGAELRIKLTRRQLRETRRALRRHRRVVVRLDVVATDTAGNSASRRAPRIRIVR
jgi:Ca2+-binding RTX toxin-like protein